GRCQWFSRQKKSTSKKRNGGTRVPPFQFLGGLFDYWNRRRTAWLACDASDRAVVDSCWRVCKASKLAPSSFESASVSASEPACSVLIVALVKSWRICTVDRPELSFCDSDRNVVSAAVRSLDAASMSVEAAQLFAELAMLRVPLASV